MSFGKTSCAYPHWIKEAFLYAEKHDVLIVAGAGNDSSDNDSNPFYPIDYDLQVQVPGEKDGVLKPFSELSTSSKMDKACITY